MSIATEAVPHSARAAGGMGQGGPGIVIASQLQGGNMLHPAMPVGEV